MTNMPLVTLGVPVYNSEDYLVQSIKSLLEQTYSDFVLIISDNASTDGTADICHSFAKKDSRIRYYRNDVNIGLPCNFNRIAELTETKYLKWTTSDDYNDPTFVEKALAVMEQDPSIVLCYPKTTLIDNDGENPRPYEDNLHLMQDDPAERFRELYSRIAFANAALGLIRVSPLKRTHLFRTFVGSDYNFLAEMALHGKFYELPERLFYRRFHPKSGSWKPHDPDHHAKYFLAEGERKLPMGHRRKWLKQQADCGAVLSAPIPLSKKVGLLAWLSLRFVRWPKRLLLRIIDLGRSRSR